jgi:hypothetical protein
MQALSLYPVAFWVLDCMYADDKIVKDMDTAQGLAVYHNSGNYTSVHLYFHIDNAVTVISCYKCSYVVFILL